MNFYRQTRVGLILMLLLTLFVSGCNSKTAYKKNILAHKTYHSIPKPVKVYEENAIADSINKDTDLKAKDVATHVNRDIEKKETKLKFMPPVEGTVQPVYNTSGKITAARLFSSTTQNVKSVLDGIIIGANENKNFGCMLVVYCSDYDLTMSYIGLDKLRFKPGDKVSKGQGIGIINPDAPIRFSVKQGNNLLDPRDYFTTNTTK